MSTMDEPVKIEFEQTVEEISFHMMTTEIPCTTLPEEPVLRSRKLQKSVVHWLRQYMLLVLRCFFSLIACRCRAVKACNICCNICCLYYVAFEKQKIAEISCPLVESIYVACTTLLFLSNCMSLPGR